MRASEKKLNKESKGDEREGNKSNSKGKMLKTQEKGLSLQNFAKEGVRFLIIRC